MSDTDRKHNSALTERARQLRKNMTPEEKLLWYKFLRTYSVRFLRQKVIDCYIADFYCHDARLIIELDGEQHYREKGIEKDFIRTENLRRRGLNILRIPNHRIREHFEDVCRQIDLEVQKALKSPQPDARWY